ncbi:MAG: hypothetical protein AAGD35_07310 [Actinomycetota bacterium]
MAETTLPPVRGRTRHHVASILVVAATVSGAVAGLVAAVIVAIVRWALAPLLVGGPLGPSAVADGASLGPTAILVAVAVAADLAVLTIGRPTPLAVGRQVPQAWGRLLAPPVVAALYGARLGVGPLTVLSTWTWWAVTVASAMSGPLPAMVVGATFGLVRMAVVVAVSATTTADGASARFGGLQRLARPGWATLNGTVLAAVAITTVAACSVEPPTLDAAPAESIESTVPAPPPVGAADGVATTGGARRPEGVVADRAAPAAAGDEARTSPAPDGGSDGRSAAHGALTPVVTTPRSLEDVVRTPQARLAEALDPAPTAPVGPPPSAEPSALATVLLARVPGFVPIDETGADRFLDMAGAAAIQPDPTEEIALLETRGYRGGWTRAFRSTGNDVLVASVYQFDDSAQAEFYLEDGLIVIGGYGGRFFDVEQLPGVKGFAQESIVDGEELLTLGATFQIGPRWFLLYLLGTPDSVSAQVLASAVADQGRRATGAG